MPFRKKRVRAWHPAKDNTACRASLPNLHNLATQTTPPSLLSPPLTPRYNGSAEAGIGSLKTRVFYQAAQHGVYDWTSDDVECARQQASLLTRPWGPCGPTPQDRPQARTPITQAQRDQFRQAFLQARAQILDEKGLPDEPWEALSLTAQAAVARASVRRALESLGDLLVRRRQISPPFNSPLRVNFR
jgi:hypothetical protein